VTRGLIVNGDDFGLTPGVNAGILECHARGILTSASLFANAPATAAAIDIALRTPTLGVGCHLTLVDGRPILPADQLPTLDAILLTHAHADHLSFDSLERLPKHMPLFAPHSVGVILPRHLVQDIDTLEDWNQAELMYEAINRA